MKQMFGPQRPHQRILNEIVGELGIAGERARIAPQGRNGRFDPLSETAHGSPLPVAPRCSRLDAGHAGDASADNDLR